MFCHYSTHIKTQMNIRTILADKAAIVCVNISQVIVRENHCCEKLNWLFQLTVVGKCPAHVLLLGRLTNQRAMEGHDVLWYLYYRYSLELRLSGR